MEIGDRLTFIPAAWQQFSDANVLDSFGVQREVTGTVESINREHGFCRVLYKAGGYANHECFKI